MRKSQRRSPRPTCDTPGCGRPIPIGGEGSPEICPKCLDDMAARNAKPAAKVRREFNHYYRPVPFEGVDVYRVLLLFGVTDPCLQHAIKKLLVAGGRGSKDAARDVHEAIATLTRWEDMRDEEGPPAGLGKGSARS